MAKAWPRSGRDASSGKWRPSVLFLVVGGLCCWAVGAACRGPWIGAREPHEALAPDTPDQVCLVCHSQPEEGTPAWPHGADSERYQRCTRCHGPRERPAPRSLTP